MLCERINITRTFNSSTRIKQRRRYGGQGRGRAFMRFAALGAVRTAAPEFTTRSWQPMIVARAGLRRSPLEKVTITPVIFYCDSSRSLTCNSVTVTVQQCEVVNCAVGAPTVRTVPDTGRSLKFFELFPPHSLTWQHHPHSVIQTRGGGIVCPPRPIPLPASSCRSCRQPSTAATAEPGNARDRFAPARAFAYIYSLSLVLILIHARNAFLE